MFAEVFFIAASLIAVFAALAMLISRSPVQSALWLILVMLCVAGLYVTLNAEFIAVVQVLVYAGAIMVLFLFVIMLLNLSAVPEVDRVDAKKGSVCFVHSDSGSDGLRDGNDLRVIVVSSREYRNRIRIEHCRGTFYTLCTPV